MMYFCILAFVQLILTTHHILHQYCIKSKSISIFLFNLITPLNFIVLLLLNHLPNLLSTQVLASNFDLSKIEFTMLQHSIESAVM